jgi:hypothetical protein
MIKGTAIALAFVATSASCATLQQPQMPRGHRELLTPTEYLDSDCISAFDAVKRLRPQWLWARGPAGLSAPGPDYPQVVVDDIRVGDPSELRWIPLSGIQEMRFLDAGEATVRYGLGFTSGAIVIRTGRR